MPRPKKPINYEEELMRIESLLTRKKKEIKELEGDRESLLKQQEQAQFSKIISFCKTSGLSVDEVLNKITAMSKKS